jgi:hypothetical protein
MKMYGRYTREDLLEKIEDEGGLLDAGMAIPAEEVPDEIYEYWRILEDTGPAIDMIEHYLYGFTDDEEEYEYTYN